MNLLPEKGKGKPLAVLMLLVFITAVYGLLFQPYVLKISHLDDELLAVKQHLGRMQSVAAQKPALKERLAEVQRESARSLLFVDETDFNRGAAKLVSRFKSLVNEVASDGSRCQVISTQNIRDRKEERFESVRVKVRMNCELEDLLPLLQELESQTPLVFIDNLSIYRRLMRGGRRAQPKNRVPPLDVRFDMKAYLKPVERSSGSVS